MLKTLYQDKNHTTLSQEWIVLQNQWDSYEKTSLLIKLTCLILFSSALFFNAMSFYFIVITMVFWLQDAIWKTFQSRIEPRLLQIEKAFNAKKETEQISAYQFNSQYLSYKLNGIALMKEYAMQALRPTIAYPYLILLLLGFVKIS
jgi:hypothetical protein